MDSWHPGEGGVEVAERRSFSSLVVEDDKFYNLPITSQTLYFHIGIRARDKGIINNIFTIAKCLGCSEKDVLILHTRGYIKPIPDSEFLSEWEIVHWYENNGIGETAKKRNNYKYRQWRQKVIDRDKKCVVCGSKENLHVHHIKNFAQYPMLRFDENNGITMCKLCHRKLHYGKEKENGRCKMD